MDDEQVKSYDGTISMYDDPVTIVRKLRESLASHEETPEADGHDLSQREKEILVCVAKGMLNKEIADHCNLSIHTVITHRKNITRKTGIKTVAGLTVYALLNNLIDSSSIEL
jgi:DNA-binding CsgD family transcriptional regulator